jgi:hypothetical protein
VRATISRGDAAAQVVGRLTADGGGNGTWTTSGSTACRLHPARYREVAAAGVARLAVLDDHAVAVGAVAGPATADGGGNGTWTTSGSTACKGRWNAERRG